MTSFVALYRGPSVAGARLVGVSADEDLVADVAHRLLRHADRAPTGTDQVIAELEAGKRRAIQLVHRESSRLCCSEGEAPGGDVAGASRTNS